MAQATIEQFAKDVDSYLMAAQKEPVVVTRNGQPLAVVIGMENKDAGPSGERNTSASWMRSQGRARTGSAMGAGSRPRAPSMTVGIGAYT